MDKRKLIKEIQKLKNPYPPDIFLWDNKEILKIKKGRLYEFINKSIEYRTDDIIKLIDEVWDEKNK